MIVGYAVTCDRRRLVRRLVRRNCGYQLSAVQGMVVCACLAVVRATLLDRA
jgi:hypothetical protein